MNSDFSKTITFLRKERKISQKQASMDLGISQALLSHYEKGIRECGLDFLVRIAEYYNVSCDFLLGRTPEPNGRVMDPEEIPDWSSKKDEDSMPSAAFVSLNRKIIINSINFIFMISQKTGSSSLVKSICSYFILSIYKILRILYNSNPQNDQRLFTVNKIIALDKANSVISKNEADIKASANCVKIDENDCIKNEEPLHMTSSSLLSEFPLYSASIFNLIKSGEDYINEK